MELIEMDDKCKAIAEKAYKYVPQRFKEMTKEELAVILNGIYAMTKGIAKEWKFREPYYKLPVSSECPEISELFAAMQDYKTVAFLEDCRIRLDSAMQSRTDGGFVYVIEFDDGHVKIGRSIDPESRIKNIVGGNQSKMLRQWVSERCGFYGDLERLAHRNFSSHRRGGEFFKVDFDQAVEWVAGEWAKHKIKEVA